MPPMNGRIYPSLRRKIEQVPLGLTGMWDILQNAVRNYQYNGNTNQAAAISLYAILSFIPLFILTIIAVSSICSSHPNIQKELIDTFRGFFPYLSEDLVTQMGQIEQKKTVLGWLGILSLIWFSAMIFSAMETAMNIIFRSQKSRNYVVSKLLAISMIPMGWAVGMVSVGITYIATVLAAQPLLSKEGVFIFPLFHGTLFRFVLPYLLTVAFFTLVYKVIPTAKIDWKHALTAAAMFAFLMELAKHFFAWYVAHYSRYNVIFGSLETIVILVIWVFYIALIFLFCAELVSSFRRRDLILLEKALLHQHEKRMKIDERLFRKFGRFYPEGALIFREGDTAQEMFLIIEGLIHVEKKAGQAKKVLAEFEKGQYFGEMAALINAPRTASAYAAKDSLLAVIEGSTLRHLLRESDEVSLSMLKEFSHRIQHTNLSLEELVQSSSRLSAIACLLLKWPYGQNEDPLDDMAKCTGKEREEVQEAIKDLADLGVLRLRDGHIVEFFKDRAWDLMKNQAFLQEKPSPQSECQFHTLPRNGKDP